MDAQIELYVKTCDECQRNKPSQQDPMGLMMPLPIPEYPWQQMSLDLIGPLPKTHAGHDAIVVFVDKLTKVVHYVATTMDVTAPQLADIVLREVVRLHGVPESFLSDRDPRFTAHFWTEFWGRLGSSLKMSTAYHPQTDGQTERANRTLETMLRSCVAFDQLDWDQHLAVAELAINAAKQASTGASPFALLYGREPTLPIDLAAADVRPERPSVNPSAQERASRILEGLERAKKKLEQAQRRQAKNVDAHRRAGTFRPGDSVLLSTDNIQFTTAKHLKRSAKFAERFIGPFKVASVVNDNAYVLDLPPSLQIHPTINITRLKPYLDGLQYFPSRPVVHPRPPPAASSDNGAPAWEVERILAKRGQGRHLRYLVKWAGYPVWESTWERSSNVDNAAEAIGDFEEGVAFE
jgi:hypothetical protein